jgi:hypothetical protein
MQPHRTDWTVFWYASKIKGPAHPPPRRMPRPSQSALSIVPHQYWVKRLRTGVRLRSAPCSSTSIPAAYRGESTGEGYACRAGKQREIVDQYTTTRTGRRVIRTNSNHNRSSASHAAANSFLSSSGSYISGSSSVSRGQSFLPTISRIFRF